MTKQIILVPEPKKVEFDGHWEKFDGFSNMPEQIRKRFNLKKGSWEIKSINKKGQGISASRKEVEIWGESNIAYASLIQLTRNYPGSFPLLSLEEENPFSFRGFHLDIARGGVPSISTFEELLKWLFLLKYNKFAIYFEDLFPWNDKESIGFHRGRLLDTEWNRILAISGELGIDTFPSLELLGHMEHFLKLEKYQEFSELWWMDNDCLDVSNKEARKFAQSLLKDALGKSPSNLMHIGGDETWTLGRGRSLDKLHDYQGPDLYLEHYRSLIELVTQKKKIPVLWGDMLTGMYLNSDSRKAWAKVVEDPIWDSAVIANWDYEPLDITHFVSRITEIGHKDKQIACPALHNWSTFYPDFEPAIKNVTSFLKAALKEKLPGYMITAWGDRGQECLFSFLNPLIMASADFTSEPSKWPLKYSILSGEPLKSSESRFLAGKTAIGPMIRNVLYSPLGYMSQRRPLKEDWKKEMKEFLTTYQNVDLSRDMELIRRMISNALTLSDKKFDLDLYEQMVRKYEELWLAERKPDGLENVVSRLLGTMESKRLKLA